MTVLALSSSAVRQTNGKLFLPTFGGVVTTTYRLTTIQHAVEIGTTLTRSWFRGHDTLVGKLTPRVFRSHYSDEMYKMFRPALELELIEGFRDDASALATAAIPADSDRLGWLYLMQHYQAPTQLLDWTGSVLVALYFAAWKSWTVDGEVWVMNPQQLNKVGGVGPHRPIIETNPLLKFLVDEPYWAGSVEALATECKLKDVPRCPIAFTPRRNVARMIAQKSCFTIHPEPFLGCTIPELLTEKVDLVRYVVPATAKQKLFLDLRGLGINDRTVFPDFEGLSRHVIADTWTVAYTPPEPPGCAGSVSEE